MGPADAADAALPEDLVRQLQEIVDYAGTQGIYMRKALPAKGLERRPGGCW